MAMRATLMIMAVFFLQPLALGGWLALIPDIKTALGLSKGQLAIALMGVPLAIIPGLQVAGRVISKFGPRRVSMIFFPLQSLALILPLYAVNGVTLFMALFAVGLMMAFIEVAMNVYAGRLEKQEDILIMNRCHGFWALGIMAGSACIALAPFDGFWVQIGLTIVALLGAVVSRVLPKLSGEDEAVSAPRRKLSELPRTLLLIACFMFIVTLTEGIMADWAAVYLAERLNDPTAHAGIAVTIFSGFMAGGRFLGDALKARFGAVTHARLTVTCALIGLVPLVLPFPVGLAYVGFALVGFGVSAAYPLGVSAIAALDNQYEAPNIAIAATVAIGGFMIGPPLIGFLSESFSLSVAFGALIPFLLTALWLTKWVRPGAKR